MIEVGIERIDGLDEVRTRLGNTGQVRRDMAHVVNDAARLGVNVARRRAPVRTGALRSSIRLQDVSFTTGQSSIEARFGVGSGGIIRDPLGRFAGGAAPTYPIFVHEGTGLFGRLHRIITPRHAKEMVFVGRTGIVRTRSVRGQKPQPYMREGFEAARTYIETHLDDMVRGLID